MRYFAVLALPLASVATSAPATIDGINYTVKAGDTLSQIADRYLINYQQYKPLQGQIRLAIPEHLQPGTILILPRPLLKSVPVDAQVAAFRGAVLVNNATPAIGMAVHEGAGIATANNAFVTLILSNGSKVTLPSQTSVKLSRLRKIVLDGSLDYQIELQNGRVETKATHFTDPNSRFEFKTPLATSAVRGTEFRIAYAPTGGSDSLTEVLDGAVQVASTVSSYATLVPKQTGAGLSSSGVAHIETLLPAPLVTNANELQKDDAVHFNLTPVSGAVGYHIQLAQDAGFVDVFADTKATTPAADFSDVPNGNLFVRATALSAAGFEGLSEVTSFKRKLNSIHAIVEKGGHGGYHFIWVGNGTGITSYRFQLTQSIGGLPVIDEPGMTAHDIELTNLTPGSYYWRVGAAQFEDGEASYSWTDFAKLTIAGGQ